MKIRFLIIISFAIMAFVLGGLSADDPSIKSLIQTSKTRADVVEQAQKAVVHIKVQKTVSKISNRRHFPPGSPFEDLFRNRNPRGLNQPPFNFKQYGQGSGSIISKEGYILTNNHVVGETEKISVTLHDGREFEATIIGVDPSSDIAVIKIEGENLPIIPLGNSDDIRIAETVIAIGNPFGLSNTVTMGIVSAKGRSNVGITNYEDFIQTDAAINPGNSGGPLIDLAGRVIGVNTAIFSGSGGNQGIGFAIPINMAQQIMKELIEDGKVSRGWLGVGIQNIDSKLAKALKVKSSKGALITNVNADSPAGKAGLKQGDLIVSFNDKLVKDTKDLINKVGFASPDSTAQVEIVRDGQRITIAVLLGEKPMQQSTSSVRQPTEQEKIGVTVQDLNPELARGFGYENAEGVIITSIIPNSVAQEAGLRAGMLIKKINHQPVTDVASFQTALKEVDLKEGALLLVEDPRGSRFLILKSN